MKIDENMHQIAPIILFVYNRPWHTEQTLSALSKNDLANDSVLYIYADGVKANATEGELERIKQVRELIRSKQWCKEVYIVESDVNKGLANSIIDGVTKIVNQYGRIIVLEDDIVTSKGFLKYMNDALTLYENEDQVMHISGYMYPHKKQLPETFFYNVTLCWGWATWNRAWKYYNNDEKVLWRDIFNQKKWNELDKFGYDYLKSQLAGNMVGTMKTWFIKWHSSVLLKNGYTLFPNQSLVHNIGFDTTGEHKDNSNSKYYSPLADFISVNQQPLVENKEVINVVKEFYRNLYYTPKKSIAHKIKDKIQSATRVCFTKILGVDFNKINFKQSNYIVSNSYRGKHTKIYSNTTLINSLIGNYTYVAHNSFVNNTVIGKFCSIGPNFMCGRGLHPSNGLSTSPMFYATMKQNGITLVTENKIEEFKLTEIGNDVFIGANVTVIDGVKIGNGAIVGAGAVVSKDIPPYAIAVGNPIQIKKYRYDDAIVEKLLKIKWWNFHDDQLQDIEKYFFDVEQFIETYYV